MSAAAVDVIIPVHSATRPIANAVGSVLTGTLSHVRVVVVCHNIGTAHIAAELGPWATDPRVVLLEHLDGIPSPAGPINAGLNHADAEFTALLGSDDHYERGAVDAWLATARRHRADVVIPRLSDEQGRSRRTPPLRPFRRRNLDGVRDRLAYRTVQLGLVRRERFDAVRMTEGLRTGEDVIQGASLWFSDATVAYARSAPAYVIGGGADDRTSIAPKPAAEALAFLDAVLTPDFLSTLTAAQRAAFGTKILRTHILDVMASALAQGTPDDLRALSVAVARVLEAAPTASRPLSRLEHALISGLTGGDDVNHLHALMASRYAFHRPSALLTPRWRDVLHREAPLRFLAATALTK